MDGVMDGLLYERARADRAEARLREVEAELQGVKDAIQPSLDRLTETRDEAEAEVRALREALEGIDWRAGSGGDAETLRGVLSSIRSRARAALAGKAEPWICPECKKPGCEGTHMKQEFYRGAEGGER
jgi:hypothetical protein